MWFLKFYHLVSVFVLEKLLVSRTCFVLLGMNLLSWRAVSSPTTARTVQGFAGQDAASTHLHQESPGQEHPHPAASPQSPWHPPHGGFALAVNWQSRIPACFLPHWQVLGARCCPSWSQLTPGCSRGPVLAVPPAWTGFDVAAWGDSASVWLEMLSPKPGH